MDHAPTIIPLPAHIVSQIKSSTAITSLNTVAIELLKNSLDARSQRIELAVDYCRGNCVVEDDGLGIPPLEFKEIGGLGKLHYSSKYNTSTIAYGSRGAFLASVSALSLVSITSHHHLHYSQNTLIINRSQVIARNIPAPPHQHIHTYSHGTRVAVRDLFGNMPVRVKQRVEESSRQSGIGREWEELRKLVTSLVLAWHSPILIVVRDSVSGQKLQLRGAKLLSLWEGTHHEGKFVSLVCNTLSQAMFISSPNPSSWVSIGASTPMMRIQGAISQEPAPTKAAQFLCLGIEPLNFQYGHNLLYNEINRLFENSCFGNKDPSSDSDRRLSGKEFTTNDLRGLRKGLDRWPMFFIQIRLLDLITQEVALGATHDIVEGKNSVLSSIIEVLRALILEFLKKHDFQPRTARATHVSRKGEPESASNILEGDSRPVRRNSLRSKTSSPTRTRRTGSPFDTWSRVKSGRPRPPGSIPKPLRPPEKLFSANIMYPESVVKPSKTNVGSSSSSDSNSPGLENDTPIIGRSREVTRPPFDRLPPVASGTLFPSQTLKNNPSVSDPDRTNSEEQCLNWVNPVTKMSSLINSRTGLVTQSTKIDRLTPRIVSHLKLEHLGKSPIEGHIASTEDTEHNIKSNTWVDNILRNWNNPIYRPRESSIQKVSLAGLGTESQRLLHGHRHRCTQLEIAQAFQQTSAGLDSRVSKEALREADVISQVDNKFILIKISVRTGFPVDDCANAATEMLVIVDQHAADERCRIEELLRDLCKAPVIDKCTTREALPESSVLTSVLEKPLSFVMPKAEIELLQMHAHHFANWGIIYDIPHFRPANGQPREYKVIVKCLPPLIIERCTTIPKLLVELLRSEMWKRSEARATISNVGDKTDSTDADMKYPWLKRLHSCPQVLLELLNSRACRSAIMFNDELSNDQCKALISRLAECAFPFQCAHGRPSMIPLLNLDAFTPEIPSKERANLRHSPHFGATFRTWKNGIAGLQSHSTGT